jgi:hypothetical protein
MIIFAYAIMFFCVCTSSICNHCYFGAGNLHGYSKNKKDKKGNPGNNWVHSPERNFEFSNYEQSPQEQGMRERRNGTPDFRAEPQSEIPTMQGIVLRKHILLGEGFLGFSVKL